ncbi:GNAT family N-acetyltransferase [Streptomyces sp. BE147]|uniref:GNAT family N-acetyltransferase n=1 Tax=Streptomyces sp. BE147 TaxID=3002524 RepID=UPI002E79E2D2|nr:GNAT family N-acetyltransferase [Streptomyces sp. BE147]MEE1736436.1 GNAT family N-acetyltransferase [Streptomyces sp. BE147]
MSTLVSAAPGQITARWHKDAIAAPADSRPAAHPSRTRAWAHAWQHLTTERVTDHRHLHLDDGVLSETVSFYLTPADGSPYWTSQETDADVAPVWPGPVLWAGSPHAEYGGAGTTSPNHARTAVTEGLRLAADLGACALVFPGVDTGQAALLTDTEHRTGVLNLATDVAFTRPLGVAPDDWWNGIPARHRREIRRQWRRGTEADLHLAALTGSALQSALPRFALLANTTADRHGTRLYGADMFHHLATVPGAVLLTAQSSDGHLIGGLYCWLYDGCLYLWASGLDYTHPVARLTYTWLMCEAARWAIGQHAHTIDAGRWNCQAKQRLGYHATVLRTVVHLTEAASPAASALTELSDRLGARAAPYLNAGTLW